jgi:hypothetical protein
MRTFSRSLVLSGLFLCVLPAVTANANDNGRISGNIASASGTPLRDAIIKIFRETSQSETLLIARSDGRGFFKSADLAPGTYHLHVSRPGYQPVTTDRFKIDAGRTISLDIILQEFIGYISNDDDPRNWDLKTVMRSTSDRRLIFQNASGSAGSDREEGESPFYRSGAMSIASGTSFGDENYLVGPQVSQNGVSSNFAFTEPINPHSRMIVSGQMDFGYGSFWRVRNTYNYQPDKDNDYRVSVGYGRMNVNDPGPSSMSSSQLLSQESGWRESGVQTLAVGLEGTTRVLDLLAVKYGFDYSRLSYDVSRSFFYPSVQILLAPLEGWSFQTSFTSQRVSDANTVMLPDGEVLNLSEPTIITMIGNQVSMSQVRHSEVAAQRTFAEGTAVEVAIYQDYTQGPGLPIMVTTITPKEQQSQVVGINEDHSSQQGARVTIRHKITGHLNGSLSYVFGDATNISNMNEPVSSDNLSENLAKYTQQRRQHSITGRLDATLPVTKTNVLATVRWYSGNPLTPADWFSDRMDIGTKSTNFEVRQVIPVPEFLGTAGRWEVLVDLRNILNQGKEVLPTTDGEIVLNRNPRSLRFGLSLAFR